MVASLFSNDFGIDPQVGKVKVQENCVSLINHLSNSSSYQLYLASHGPALIHCDTLETENPFPSHSELHI